MAVNERNVVLYGQGWGGALNPWSYRDFSYDKDFDEPMSVDACIFNSPPGVAWRCSHVYTSSLGRCGRLQPFSNSRGMGEREGRREEGELGCKRRDSSLLQDPMQELRSLLQQSTLADKDEDSSDEETPMEDSDDESPPLIISARDVSVQLRGLYEEAPQRMDTDGSVPSTPTDQPRSTDPKPKNTSACETLDGRMPVSCETLDGRMPVSTQGKERNTVGGNSALWTRSNLSPEKLGLSEYSSFRDYPDSLGSSSSPWNRSRCIVTARRGLNKVFSKVSRPITKLWPIRSMELEEGDDDDLVFSTAGRCSNAGLKRKAHCSGQPKLVLKKSHPVV